MSTRLRKYWERFRSGFWFTPTRMAASYLLGLDHEHLTYNYAGRDFRLTEVKGTVTGEILT